MFEHKINLITLAFTMILTEQRYEFFPIRMYGADAEAGFQ